MLTITKSGTGTGWITSSPTGIDCDLGCTQQSASFAQGTPVTLTAQAGSGSTFQGWTGGTCSGTGQCVVTVGSDIMVGAQFTGQGPAKVPSLSEWGTIICAFFLAGSAIWLIRRRQRS